MTNIVKTRRAKENANTEGEPSEYIFTSWANVISPSMINYRVICSNVLIRILQYNALDGVDDVLLESKFIRELNNINYVKFGFILYCESMPVWILNYFCSIPHFRISRFKINI